MPFISALLLVLLVTPLASISVAIAVSVAAAAHFDSHRVVVLAFWVGLIESLYSFSTLGVFSLFLMALVMVVAVVVKQLALEHLVVVGVLGVVGEALWRLIAGHPVQVSVLILQAVATMGVYMVLRVMFGERGVYLRKKR